MANKQKHKYSLGFNTWDQIKALAGSAKRRIEFDFIFLLNVSKFRLKHPALSSFLQIRLLPYFLCKRPPASNLKNVASRGFALQIMRFDTVQIQIICSTKPRVRVRQRKYGMRQSLQEVAQDWMFQTKSGDI